VDGVGDLVGHGLQVPGDEGLPDAVDGADDDEELGQEEDELGAAAALVVLQALLEHLYGGILGWRRHPVIIIKYYEKPAKLLSSLRPELQPPGLLEPPQVLLAAVSGLLGLVGEERCRDKGAIVEGLVDGGLDVAMLKYVKLNQKYRYLDHQAAAELRNGQDEKAQWSGYNLGGARPGSSQPQPTTQPQERSGRDPSSSFFAPDAT
jgi:hypothetical protein